MITNLFIKKSSYPTKFSETHRNHGRAVGGNGLAAAVVAGVTIAFFSPENALLVGVCQRDSRAYGTRLGDGWLHLGRSAHILHRIVGKRGISILLHDEDGHNAAPAGSCKRNLADIRRHFIADIVRGNRIVQITSIGGQRLAVIRLDDNHIPFIRRNRNGCAPSAASIIMKSPDAAFAIAQVARSGQHSGSVGLEVVELLGLIAGNLRCFFQCAHSASCLCLKTDRKQHYQQQ